MRRYTGEEYEILRKSIYSVLDELWSVARTFKKDICGLTKSPYHSDGGAWMRIFSYNIIHNVLFIMKDLNDKKFMSSLTNDTLNVLFINQKVINAQPKAELIIAKDFSFGDFEFADKIDYVMVITDDVTLSLAETDIQGECLINDWILKSEKK